MTFLTQHIICLKTYRIDFEEIGRVQEVLKIKYNNRNVVLNFSIMQEIKGIKINTYTNNLAAHR